MLTNDDFKKFFKLKTIPTKIFSEDGILFEQLRNKYLKFIYFGRERKLCFILDDIEKYKDVIDNCGGFNLKIFYNPKRINHNYQIHIYFKVNVNNQIHSDKKLYTALNIDLKNILDEKSYLNIISDMIDFFKITQVETLIKQELDNYDN